MTDTTWTPTPSPADDAPATAPHVEAMTPNAPSQPTEPVLGLPAAGAWPTAPSVAPATAPAEKRSRKAIAFALAAGLLVGAAGTGAVLVATDAGNDTATPATTLSQVATSATTPSRTAGTVAAVAAEVLPSVVSIKGTGGEGSGIILDAEGHILTNNHVAVLGENGGSLTVVLQDGRSAAATVVGLDPSTDLAIIKVDGVDNLKPITLGKSSELAVGDQVLAIGSPLGLSGTVTEGIVSALHRPVTAGEASATSPMAVFEAIQTDAAINPGNSGGALVDANGHLIGINSAIASLGSGSGGQSGSIGLGFAIPVDQATRIAQELIANGTATHARLGTTVGETQDGSTGATLGEVSDGSAAADAGLQSGDVITKIDGRVIDGAEGLVAAIRSQAPGTEVTLTYTRDGNEQTATVTLGSDAGTA